MESFWQDLYVRFPIIEEISLYGLPQEAKYFGLGVLLVLILLAGSGIFQTYKSRLYARQKASRCTLQTLGTVVRIDCRVLHNHDDETNIYNAIVEYAGGREVHMGDMATRQLNPQRGDKFTVCYNPDDPSDAVVSADLDLRLNRKLYEPIIGTFSAFGIFVLIVIGCVIFLD